MAERILHKIKERKRYKRGPDKIITVCGSKGEAKGGWEFVTCPKCSQKAPFEPDNLHGDEDNLNLH